jgi:hypothetical protein
MTKNQTTAAIVLGLLFLAYGLPADVSAKPKRPSVFGCTTEDLNTGFGSSCVSQAEQDIMKGNSYTHVMICEGGQQKCCTVSNGSGQILNCRRPAGSAAMTQSLQPLTSTNTRPGSIQSRGVEGAEDIGEETPVPSWLTESWLKEHEGEKPSK